MFATQKLRMPEEMQRQHRLGVCSSYDDERGEQRGAARDPARDEDVAPAARRLLDEAGDEQLRAR